MHGQSMMDSTAWRLNDSLIRHQGPDWVGGRSEAEGSLTKRAITHSPVEHPSLRHACLGCHGTVKGNEVAHVLPHMRCTHIHPGNPPPPQPRSPLSTCPRALPIGAQPPLATARWQNAIAARAFASSESAAAGSGYPAVCRTAAANTPSASVSNRVGGLIIGCVRLSSARHGSSA